MKFSEKLNYLFELSHAEGKELAEEMSITPPQISKMRQGIRGLPKNEDSARMIAHFFAIRLNDEYERDELAKKLKVPRISTIDNDKDLTNVLLDWISTEESPDEYASRRADDFLRKFGLLFRDDEKEEEGFEKMLSPAQSSFLAYYGGEGKRMAYRTFLNYVLHQSRNCTIDILSDENAFWITEDSAFSKEMQDLMLQLTELGCKFRRIAGPPTDMDQAFESLQRWFPLYMKGKATSYTYKRLRDNLNRITIFAVQNVAVMFSFSVGNVVSQDSVTFFTTDIRTVNSMELEFERYLSVCDPIMKVYSADNSFKQMHECMLDFEGYDTECIQVGNSLSFITLPWDIAVTLGGNDQEEDKEYFLNAFAVRHRKFEYNLDNNPFYDIIRIADVDSILNGKVPIPASYVLGKKVYYYQPKDYVKHLRCILYLLEHKKNYNVILKSEDDKDEVIVSVKEGFCAVIAREAFPFSVYEVSERNLVEAFMEYMRRRIPEEATDTNYKKSVIAVIRELINRIERLLNR